jgi:hypothetical protein
MSAFEQLSPLDRQKVDHHASLALNAAFTAMHEQTGWCGDVMREYWDAALPALREEMAKMIRQPLPNGTCK